MSDDQDDEEETPRRRGKRPLTADELLVRDAHWPGFRWSKNGWPDPDVLRGLLGKWIGAGRPSHDDGSACACPLGAAWPCTCPDTCSRCERRSGLGPFGRHRYGGLWPTCPTAPGWCACPDYSDEELDAEIKRHALERWFLASVGAPRPAVEQGTLFG